MRQLTIPTYFAYLEDLSLDDLNLELETANQELKEAQTDVKNASSYGGFEKALKVARRRHSAATEEVKYIRLAIKEKTK